MLLKAILHVLTVLLLINTGTNGKSTKSTIVPCIFKEVATCYNYMRSMGGNMTYKYATTYQEVIRNCTNNSIQFEQCLLDLDMKCGKKVNLNKNMRNVRTLARDLCGADQTAMRQFMNASHDCYNAKFDNITSCNNRYGAHGKNDTKSLCKANKHTVKCIEDVIDSCKNVSTRYILNTVIATYNAYAPLICGSSSLYTTSVWILGSICLIIACFFLN